MGGSISSCSAVAVPASFALGEVYFQAQAVATGCDLLTDTCPTGTCAWRLASCGPPGVPTSASAFALALPEAPSFDDRKYGFGVYVGAPSDGWGPAPVTFELQAGVFLNSPWPEGQVLLDTPEWHVATGCAPDASPPCFVRLLVTHTPTPAPADPCGTMLYVCGVMVVPPTVDLAPGTTLRVRAATVGALEPLCVLQAMKLRLALAPGPAQPTAPRDVTSTPECERDGPCVVGSLAPGPATYTVKVTWGPAAVPMINQTGWQVRAVGPLASHYPVVVVAPDVFSVQVPMYTFAGGIIPQFVVCGVGVGVAEDGVRPLGTQTPYSDPSKQACAPPCPALCGGAGKKAWNSGSGGCGAGGPRGPVRRVRAAVIGRAPKTWGEGM